MDKNDSYYQHMVHEPKDFIEQGRSYTKKMNDFKATATFVGGFIAMWSLYELLCFLLIVFK